MFAVTEQIVIKEREKEIIILLMTLQSLDFCCLKI